VLNSRSGDLAVRTRAIKPRLDAVTKIRRRTAAAVKRKKEANHAFAGS
jgi:hypothetical protein